MNKRVRLQITGRVQGVGFRPTVYRHATALRLSGFVQNSPSGVVVEAEGPEADLQALESRIREQAPPQARITGMELRAMEPLGSEGFEIRASAGSGDLTVGMPPDLATCPECRAELFSREDRRFRYPFINCTNCGPRFTLIESLPYDRARTSMKHFAMCADCSAEYHDPLDRRFDAQPDACPQCGPKVMLVDTAGREMAGNPVLEAAGLIRKGAILAVKGLGGYHLCCDARNAEAVRLLRTRKSRPAKALAIMCRDLDQAAEYVVMDDAERQALQGPERPIVILDRQPSCELGEGLSPDTRDLGVFLPYTPLHELLLAEVGPLVMTSGNRADEPIAQDEAQLASLLGAVADHALVHDRGILRRCDDSVMRLVSGEPLLLRRSRGLVPASIPLPVAGEGVLACGGDLKNAFCVTRGSEAFVSQHIGDLEDPRTVTFYMEAVDDLCALLQVKPSLVAHDLHPGYASTRLAMDRAEKRVAVQHHHAHMAAVMVEHGLTQPVIGVSLDGLGYGTDGTLWGGEFFTGDLTGFERLLHFKSYRMPGGDAATRHPERMAFSYLFEESADCEKAAAQRLAGLDSGARKLLARLLSEQVRSPVTSSAGRLFDGVSALLGFRGEVSYEGQAAIRLQTLAQRAKDAASYGFVVEDDIVDFGDLIRGVLQDLERGVDLAAIALGFHQAVARAVVEGCGMIRENTGLTGVTLSGGVFQNVLLLKQVRDGLRDLGFAVYSHRFLPPNDGCIALGQAAVALARVTGNKE